MNQDVNCGFATDPTANLRPSNPYKFGITYSADEKSRYTQSRMEQTFTKHLQAFLIIICK